MKSVIIKRATMDGISVCYGELFEYAGYQFCITDNIYNEVFHAIEVRTGLSAHSVCISEYSSKRACINALKRWIKEHIGLFNDDLLERSKGILSKHNLDYPLNNIQ